MMIIIHETDQNNFTPIDLGNCVAIEIAKKKRKKNKRKKEKKKNVAFPRRYLARYRIVLFIRRVKKGCRK